MKPVSPNMQMALDLMERLAEANCSLEKAAQDQSRLESAQDAVARELKEASAKVESSRDTRDAILKQLQSLI